MQNILKEIRALIGEENLFCAHSERLAYARQPDFSCQWQPPILPMAVACPRHEGQLTDLLEFCDKEKIPLAIRGGGTVPNSNILPQVQDTLILLTTGLNRILKIEADDRLAVIQPGVTCAALAGMANKDGLFWPIEPFAKGLATIGGIIAQNTAGSASIKYGTAGNYIDKLEVFATNGKKFICDGQNGQPGKITPSLPIAHLFCGSMGVLGVIGTISLRLLPMPQTEGSILAEFSDFEAASFAASQIMANMLVPRALEMADPTCASIIKDDPSFKNSLLFLQFDGIQEQVKEDITVAEKILAQNHVIKQHKSISIDDNCAGASQFLTRYSCLPPSLNANNKIYIIKILVCPPSRVSNLISGIIEITNRYNIRTAIFGHAGIARINVAVFQNENPQAVKEALSELFTLQLTLNNLLVEENDANLSAREWKDRQKEHGIMKISQQLRTIFDPAGLLSSHPLPGECDEILAKVHYTGEPHR